MSIQHAILGFLSWRELTGYELKKLFADSPAFHWSGNNNQIYRTLVGLHERGMVTVDVQPQEHLPARKVYTITEEGRAALREWLLSKPELPDCRSVFLVQLAWADQLGADELSALTARYEHEVEMQLLMAREQGRRGEWVHPARTPREDFLWSMIAENRIQSLQSELGWVRKVREGLQEVMQNA